MRERELQEVYDDLVSWGECGAKRLLLAWTRLRG
jgi:hypothetical protein